VSAAKSYSRRLFVTYQELIEGGNGRDLEAAVHKYAIANRGVNLDQPMTFRQWFAEAAPARRARSQ
jgi:hypothetical protein